MSVDATEHAVLAMDSYVDHTMDRNKDVPIGEHRYRILDTYNDPVTGYQGTAYVRLGADNKPTGDVVIAHRGTEIDARDIATDAAMVFTGINAQIPDAEAFTKRVLEKAKSLPELQDKPLNITVTGHSLGGTLAEYTAYKFHLHGETFNAYGAAGLLHGVPEGGSDVINYVRATDVVSAGSRHHGEVRVLATEPDIPRLHNAGYREDGTGFLRNTLVAIDPKAHAIATFVPEANGHSVLDPENAARYRAHHAMVDRYRDDVLVARTALSAKWELEKQAGELGAAAGKAAADGLTGTSRVIGAAAVHSAHAVTQAATQMGQDVAHGASQTYDSAREAAILAAKTAGHAAAQASQAVALQAEAIGDVVSHGARTLGNQAARAGAAISDGVQHVGETLRHPESLFDHAPARSATPALPARLDDPAHPGHAMFRQGLEGVQQLNAQHGVASNATRDANLAGSLTAAAAAKGIDRIDQVALSEDATHAFALRQHHLGEPWDQWAARVNTVRAINTPLEQSSAQFSQAMQQGQEQQQTHAQVQQSAPQATLGMAR
jgi:hypothetical protein